MSLFALFVLSISPVQALQSDLNLLSELVSISSGTANVNGVNEVQSRISAELQKLGMDVKLISNPKADVRSGKLLVAEKKGQDPRFLTLVAHADTVFEKLVPFKLSPDKDIVYGSGVSDNKGGIVVGISALKKVLNGGPTRLSVRVVVSPSEETGSIGFHELFKRYSQDSVFVLGLEPARENASIVTSRKGEKWYHIQVTGKEAHAGVDHASGVNACLELAMILNQISKLTEYTAGTTVSVGHIEGGKDKYNIVCGEASAKIDTRFSTEENEKKLSRKIEKILSKPRVESAKTHERAKITFTVPERSPPLELSEEARPYVQKYLKWAKELEGREIKAESTGGVADLNMMARAGLPLIDGLGPVGGGSHTVDEYIEVKSLETRAVALEKLIREIDRLLK